MFGKRSATESWRATFADIDLVEGGGEPGGWIWLVSTPASRAKPPDKLRPSASSAPDMPSVRRIFEAAHAENRDLVLDALAIKHTGSLA